MSDIVIIGGILSVVGICAMGLTVHRVWEILETVQLLKGNIDELHELCKSLMRRMDRLERRHD